MTEKNYRKCKTCKLLKIRISDGKFPNGVNKRFRDEHNNLWSGNVCGECNKVRLAKAMKKSRRNK